MTRPIISFFERLVNENTLASQQSVKFGRPDRSRFSRIAASRGYGRFFACAQ